VCHPTLWCSDQSCACHERQMRVRSSRVRMQLLGRAHLTCHDRADRCTLVAACGHTQTQPFSPQISLFPVLIQCTTFGGGATGTRFCAMDGCMRRIRQQLTMCNRKV